MKKGKQIAYCFAPFLVSMLLMYGVSIMFSMFLIFLSGITGNPMSFATSPEEGSLSLGFVATALVHLVYILVFGTWYFRTIKYLEKPETKRPIKVKDILFLLILALVLQIAVSLALAGILPLVPSIEKEYEALMETAGIGQGIGPLILTGVMAPIGEELIFRGLTLQFSMGKLPFWCVNLIQALLFGVYHLNIVQGIYAFVIGLLLGLIMKKYQDIRACMILHAFINIWGNVL